MCGGNHEHEHEHEHEYKKIKCSCGNAAGGVWGPNMDWACRAAVYYIQNASRV
jgi:hypothetical protein